MSAEELELDELLGAYALDAVSDEERRAVEQYLLISPRARQEVAEHREVATMLAWSGMAAPDGLWDRIAANLESSGEAPRPTGQLASVMALDDDRRAAIGVACCLPSLAHGRIVGRRIGSRRDRRRRGGHGDHR